MNALRPSRPTTGLLVAVLAVLAVCLPTLGSPAPALAADALRAPAPVVKYTEVKVTCYPVSYDGVESTQCQAMMTVVATRVARGYVITTFQASNNGPSQVLRFTAAGAKAEKRTSRPGVVCRTSGGGERATHYRFYTVVKDATGKTVLRTKPAKVC